MNYKEIKEIRKWNEERGINEEEIIKTLYFCNIEDIVEQSFNEKYDEVEIYGDEEIDLENNTVKMYVKTLTECSDPDVNYYDDGMNEIWYAREKIEEILQCDVTFVSDLDIGGDDWDVWVNHHGYFIIKIGKYYDNKKIKEKIEKIKIPRYYCEFTIHNEVKNLLTTIPQEYREQFVEILLKEEQTSTTIEENLKKFKKMIK